MSIPEFEPAALSEVVDDLMESYSDHAYLTNLQGLSLRRGNVSKTLCVASRAFFTQGLWNV